MNILIIKPRYNSTSKQMGAVFKSLLGKDNETLNEFTSVSDHFPENWNVKTIDLNYQPLHKREVKNADFVLVSAGNDQKDSALKVFDNCKYCFSSIVVHGSVFSDNIHSIDHLIVGNVKQCIDQLIHDFNAGIPERIYTSSSTGAMVDIELGVKRGGILDMLQRNNLPALE